MAARSIASGTLSFGLVSIPVRFYVATHSERVSFNMIHAECGSRIKQQLYCPVEERVVDRDELVKGFEFAKDRYVTFTDEEIKALEAEANRSIDIREFVPLDKVDPLYFEAAHYLGPDHGAEKAYRLLSEAMAETERVAVAQYTSHGKEQIVIIRPYDGGGLVLHLMHYADEVRKFEDIKVDGHVKLRENEIDLARKLIEQLSEDEFRPDQYKDEYRDRVKAAIERKVAGEEVTVAEAPPARAQVIDLMEALKQSLGRTGTREQKAEKSKAGGARRPAAAARSEAERPQRRARKKS
jgi:DNA end-binding protein Ku